MFKKSDSLSRLADAVRGLEKDPEAKWGDGPVIKFLTQEFGLSERLALYHRKHPVRAKLLAVALLAGFGLILYGVSFIASVTDWSRY